MNIRTYGIRGILSLIAFTLTLIAATSSRSFADFSDSPQPGETAGIWPEIPFIRGGDYKGFEETMSQTRDQVRRTLLAEFASILIPLVQPGDDTAQLASVVAQILLTFDNMHEQHKEEAHAGIAKSLEADFKAALDTLYEEKDISDGERKVAFLRDDGMISQFKELAKAIRTKKGKVTGKIARDILDNVDFIMYGSYTVTNGAETAEVILTLTIEKYQEGQTRSFTSKGRIEYAIKDLAAKVFDFFQSNRYPQWMNPEPQLVWIQAAKGQPKASVPSITSYCAGQGARLPYARELERAAQGTQYAKGGITPFQPGEIYAVADRKFYDKPYYYFVGQEDTGAGLVRTDAGYGAILANYWCVRGGQSKQTRFVEELYRLWRRSSDQEVRNTVEYLLNQVSDYAADPSYAALYPDLGAALRALKAKDIRVKIPPGLIAR